MEVVVRERPAEDARAVATVLSEIAEIASETLELKEVFDRVAMSVRKLIPFDNMGVVRIVDDERAVLHASTVPCMAPSLECLEPVPLTSWSPRMRPRPGPNPRIEDAQIECDPSYPFDARALQGGVRSGMWEPFRSMQTLRGGVWLASYQPHAFTEAHQEVLRPIAALLGSAVEHWRIWDA
ncbi:MAG: GAF domain-containing protein, partial [Candidatus Rokuibacteriota bacterium]